MPIGKLGRRPPKNAPALHLRDIRTGAVPAHPGAADHFSKVSDWGLWGNDTYGDCGPVSYGNLRKLVSSYLTGLEDDVTEADVLELYKLVNPSFDPADPGGPGDAGVDMQTMLELALEHGFAGKKPLAFAKVDVSSLEEVRAAISIFGGVLFGVDLETAQQGQTDKGGPWDYKRSSEWGGHAIVSGRYASLPPAAGANHAAGIQLADRTGVVSWAQVVDATDAFLSHQLEECWVVIFEEHREHPAFQEGIDDAKLAAAYEALTGRPFPAVQPPAPTPPPADDPLAELATMFRQWIGSIEAWLKGHGL